MTIEKEARVSLGPKGSADTKELPAQSDSVSEEDSWDRLGRAIDRFLPTELHIRLLWLLMTAGLLLRLFWLARPEGALIFDESYYVNAARVIAGLPPTQDRYPNAPPGLDPNTEHPPLAKLIVAGSIRLLGDNAYGWRIPSVIFGTASILLMYGITRRLGAGPYVALLAATLLAFDNLAFVHSRIFTLDIFQIAFMLLGLYWYVDRRATLSGVGFALATLCKIGGILGPVALVAYEGLRLVRREGPWQTELRRATRRLLRMGVTYTVAFLLFLGITDYLWVGYSQPLEHLQRIVGYGQLLRRQVPQGIESYPWQWLWNDIEIPYLRVDQEVRVGDEVREKRPLIFFLGAMNPFVLELWPLALPFVAYAWWSRRSGSDLGALALAWFAVTYLPFVVVSLIGQRISYLFYFLPTVPAVVLAGSYFLLSMGLPRIVIWTYVGAVLLGFYGYFPFKPVP